jgi:hypothetical protein
MFLKLISPFVFATVQPMLDMARASYGATFAQAAASGRCSYSDFFNVGKAGHDGNHPELGNRLIAVTVSASVRFRDLVRCRLPSSVAGCFADFSLTTWID